MFVTERRNKILALLKEKQRLTVLELATSLNVSEATLRSDLTKMEKEGLLTRTHGGAILNDLAAADTSFSARVKKNQKEKTQIAKRAFHFVEDKQCILLDASSTALEFANYLKQQSIRLTVVTTSAKAALELNENPDITVILIGGMMTKGSSAIEGTLGLSILDQVNIDIMFTSANGFTPETGLTDFNLYEVQLKRELVHRAKIVVALIDHTKIGSNSSSIFAKTNQIDTIITDKELDDSITNHSFMKDVRIIVAATKNEK
ncbi:DeoR/GlpR family DNA-binding transcription regulator [Neobacillus niacini]|uniref:DeoR/GlpR family DNA-binding transcription regulator n=1 Tax=Neobacillus niacini TaxID=86668 RepID=UPI00333EA8CC